MCVMQYTGDMTEPYVSVKIKAETQYPVINLTEILNEIRL